METVTRWLSNDSSKGYQNGLTNGSSKVPANGYTSRQHAVVKESIPYGKRLIMRVVDELGRDEPGRVWASIARSTTDISQGFRDITMRQLVSAINYTAWWLDGQIGQSKTFEVIAYIGVSDIRYPILLFATIKCGYQLLIPSVRNSESGNLSLLNELNCSKLIHSPEFGARIDGLKQAKPGTQSWILPMLDELLTGQAKHFPYEKSWPEAQNDPVMIAHTSGSTGAPKPITITNGVYCVEDNLRLLPKVKGRKNQDYSIFDFDGGGRFYSSFPPFHLAGILALSGVVIFYNATIVLGPSEKPPSGEILSDIMSRYKLRAAWCPPTVIEQLLQEPTGFEQAAALEFIIYTGGPLAPSVGDRLSQVTDVCQIYGSTEIGVQAALVPLRENWQWLEWSPHLQNVLDPVEDGLYEMVVPANASYPEIRQLRHTFPKHVGDWRTRDLFRRHPTNPRLWQFQGRRDDILGMSNGEKFNPVTMEGIIQGHSLVRGALIVGTARFQAGLIIEPKPDVTMSDEELIEEVWPSIDKANVDGPAHAQIFRSKVMVASPGKPFIRAGKGTVVRGQTNRLYKEELDALYSGANADRLRAAPRLDLPYNLDALRRYVRTSALPFIRKGEFADDDDFFANGVDSLQTLELTNTIKFGLKKHMSPSALSVISTRTIYAHPNVGRLAAFLDRLLNQGAGSNRINDNAFSARDAEAQRCERISAMVERYTKDLPPSSASTSKDIPIDRFVVVLTGSTGTLGTNILQVLLEDSQVIKVYCLNRAPDALERHQKAFADRVVHYDLATKVEFLQAEFGGPQFGLESTKFKELKASVNVIVHNAWKVDFNHTLESFDAHIRGVRDFVDWSISSHQHPHIFFVSSISSVGNWAKVYGAQDPVPEKPPRSYSIAQNLGYGESKHVSECILDVAAEQAGVRSSILRSGQIAGPLAPNGGEWNRNEWLPSLLRTSKNLGCILNSLSTIDWIPVDELARVIVELVHMSCQSNISQVYNLVNPKIAEWADLLHAVQKHWPTIKVISSAEWIEKLKAIDAEDTANQTLMPALKILDFFEGMERGTRRPQDEVQRYETKKSVAASKTMADLGPVNAEAMETWLQQWNF